MALIQARCKSQSLCREIDFLAFLPSGEMDDVLQGENPFANRTSFKTLYLLHGFHGNCGSWFLNSRVMQYAREKRLAVICPSGENSFYTDNRNNNRFATFVSDELIQMTRYMFNLSHNREDTFIAGLSMGGYGSLRLGLSHSDTYGAIGAFSLALITSMDGQDESGISEMNQYLGFDMFLNIFSDLGKIGGSYDLKTLVRNCENLPGMYIACGTEDSLIETNRSYHRFLNENKIEHTYEEWTGIHDYVFWDTAVKKFIEWLGL